MAATDLKLPHRIRRWKPSTIARSRASSARSRPTTTTRARSASPKTKSSAFTSRNEVHAMTDEQPETGSPKRGRPRGSGRRSARREPVHRLRSSDDPEPLQNFEYKPYEAENPLAID